MKFKSIAIFSVILMEQSLAAAFTSYDTTVQVKIWNNGIPDSTFIKLRNTGFIGVFCEII